MTLFRNVVFLAALAGLVAGLAMTALQTVFTVPLILQAETYEGMAPASAPAAAAHDHGDGAHSHDDGAHSHDADAWAPQDGAERMLFTALANIVTGIGFALLLVSASELAGGVASWRHGLVWGFAGFAAFTLAPGLGLPPELPGMPAADLFARQVWWIAAAAATIGGLALIAFGRGTVLPLLGVALLVAPHLVGAPQPVSHDTAVPADLHHRFVVAVTMTNLVFWLLLGSAVGAFRTRLAEPAGTPQPSLG